MIDPILAAFMSGAATTGFIVAGGFFLKFWARTHDRLFATFAVAFWLLALSQALTTVSGVPREEQSWIYLIRLLAFLVIIVAVLAKNLGGDPRR